MPTGANCQRAGHLDSIVKLQFQMNGRVFKQVTRPNIADELLVIVAVTSILVGGERLWKVRERTPFELARLLDAGLSNRFFD